MDIEKYREVRLAINELELKLNGLQELKTAFENEIFSEMVTGEEKVVGQYLFQIKQGRRGLSPKGPWVQKLDEWTNQFDSPQKFMIMKRIHIKEIVEKSCTLGELDKMIGDMGLENKAEELYDLLGLKVSASSRAVKVIEFASKGPSTIQVDPDLKLDYLGGK